MIVPPALGNGRRKNLNIVRRIKNGFAEPDSPYLHAGLCSAPTLRWHHIMKGRKKKLWDLAEEERRCCDWLIPFMQNDRPKLLTKAALRNAALRELNVSQNSFDFEWIDAIEMTSAAIGTSRWRFCIKLATTLFISRAAEV